MRRAPMLDAPARPGGAPGIVGPSGASGDLLGMGGGEAETVPLHSPPSSARRQPVVPLPSIPRRIVDTDTIRNQPLERGCMSERELDASGALRMLRFCPAALAPGSVAEVQLQFRDKMRSPRLAPMFEGEVAAWREITHRKLQAAVRHGAEVVGGAKELSQWVARANALLCRKDEVDCAPLTLDLLQAAKTLHTIVQDEEKHQQRQKLMEVVERLHAPTPRSQQDSTESQCLPQLQNFDGCHAEHDSHQCTAKDFVKALMKKYESVEDAWDDLDVNGDGVLQFHEFVAGCRKVHIVGNLRRLFDDLSSNDGESIRLTDIDPSMKQEEHRRTTFHTETIRQRRIKRASYLHSPANVRLSTPRQQRDGHGDFDLDMVWSHCKDIAAPMCRHSRSRWAVEVGDSEVGGGKCSTSELNSTGGRAGLDLMQTTGEIYHLLNNTSWRVGDRPVPCSAKDLCNALLKKFMRLDYAWDQLDLNGDGVLQFHEFVAGCRRINVHGNLRQMFNAVSSDGGKSVRLTDLDPSMRGEEERRIKAREKLRLERDRETKPRGKESPRERLAMPRSTANAGHSPRSVRKKTHNQQSGGTPAAPLISSSSARVNPPACLL